MVYHGDIIVYQEELWCTGEIYGVPRGHYGVPRGHYGVPKGDNLSGREEVIRSCTMERYNTHKNMTIAVNTTVKKKREAPKQKLDLNGGMLAEINPWVETVTWTETVTITK